VDLYLVEAGTPGFEKGKRIRKVGWHSQDTAERTLRTAAFQDEPPGEKGTGFLKLMLKLQQERLVCAIGAVGAAEYILELTLDYCRKRSAFGRPLSKFQHVQFELVEMTAEVKLGRTFLDKLIVEHMEGENIVVDVSLAKYWTTDMPPDGGPGGPALRGYGYCEEYPIAGPGGTRGSCGSRRNERDHEGIAARFMGCSHEGIQKPQNRGGALAGL
jgi:acyl-CoA dehydrogenase